MGSPNTCTIITENPEETLGDASDKQMAEAAAAIINMMSTDGLDILAEKLAGDEMTFDGLLSALERHQPA